EMDYGNACLFAKEFDAAWEHFSGLIKVDVDAGRPTSSIFYEMAGTAKWCLNECDEALSIWRTGLSAGFTDWAGGVEVPLLLLFTSVVKAKRFQNVRVEAVNLLTKRAKRDRIENWPGPLALFALSRFDEKALRANCRGHDDHDTNLYNWLADFYI